ncbi:hypothetical protein PIROE2DRAFT_11996 [Piromyces sp. E2]|nr:hypothetical protein PIROE2DRAFT_11996 [Piromyces sp. E2]|eukprot:OUM61883.1 hypothetical protein PIROE2DRAFT_11996 [Piromyces sp. E2]
MKLFNIISVFSLLTFTFASESYEINSSEKNYQISSDSCVITECLPLTGEQKQQIPECHECRENDEPKCYDNEFDAFGDDQNIYFSTIVNNNNNNNR